MRDPWRVTLFTYAMILDADRIDGVRDELRASAEAQRHALGFHEPKRLWSDAREIRSRLFAGADVQAAKLSAADRAEVERIIAIGTKAHRPVS